jgi:hypothetical protein
MSGKGFGRSHASGNGDRNHPQVRDERPNKKTSPFAHLPPKVTPDCYMSFLNDHWDVFAALAYEGYLKEGKGLILVDWDLSFNRVLGNALMSPSCNSLQAIALDNRLSMPTFFAGMNGVLFQEDVNCDFFSENCRSLINRYDPETSLVLALCWGFSPTVRGEMMIRTLALANGMNPREAYAALGSRLSEFEVKPVG